MNAGAERLVKQFLTLNPEAKSESLGATLNAMRQSPLTASDL
jgi:hypothetical protein